MEVTLEITQYCPYECDYCSSYAGPRGKHLDFRLIENFLSGISDIERVNISGGEPLAHPDFWRILQLSYSYTTDVWVYTNALRQIKYNSDIIEEMRVEANVVLCPGRKVYIPKTSHQVNFLRFISQGRGSKISPIQTRMSRNFVDKCHSCDHCLLQADGKIVSVPCKKSYKKIK